MVIIELSHLTSKGHIPLVFLNIIESSAPLSISVYSVIGYQL